MNTQSIDDPNSSSYHIQVWSNPENHQYYNNIFAAVGSYETAGITQDEGIVSNNIIITNPDNLPYETISGTIQDYIDSGEIRGLPLLDSDAIDGGREDLDYPLYDIWGNSRKNLPDIGAVER